MDSDETKAVGTFQEAAYYLLVIGLTIILTGLCIIGAISTIGLPLGLIPGEDAVSALDTVRIRLTVIAGVAALATGTALALLWYLPSEKQAEKRRLVRRSLRGWALGVTIAAAGAAIGFLPEMVPTS